MNLDSLAELLAFLFTDHAFKGDSTELWKAIIGLIEQVVDTVTNFFA